MVFNVDGYYDGILTWVRGAVEACFVNGSQVNIAIEAKTAEECGLALKNYSFSQGRLNLAWTSN